VSTGFLLQDFQYFYMEVETLDELITILSSQEQSDLLRRLALARKKYTIVKSQLGIKKELLSALIRKEKIFINKNTKLYLRDVMDAIEYVNKKISAASEMLSNLNATYLAKVSIEMAEFSNKTNDILKKFTAVGTLMLPYGLIAGLLGMNVPIPFQDNLDPVTNLTPFIIIIGSMIVFGVIILWLFRRAGWI